ncbi:hypothetical protein LMH87_005343 [Akanthomyces muscarius]|uniref:Uncharacterized protein n=1 Tax=Akanthomyces muscarius TaxID=2231603 RepID=A0A9W8QN35_AKAMU|nr:hypothetical protein LMH87_005343 [Akanthomyces muscarius]KAJ4163626.1 hypothetical protein LMH87_005343 [Akanthomyces muscarius]
MSAYFSHLNASATSGSRKLAFDKYRRHRDLATRFFDSMSMSPRGVHGEAIVCGVHLALLEALANNMQSCQSYLRGVSGFLAKEESFLAPTLEFLRLNQPNGNLKDFCINYETSLDPYNATPSPLPSSMESTAAVFFTATFVWNDILCAAAEIRIPDAEAKYRLLLAEDAFSSVLREVTGCASAINYPTVLSASEILSTDLARLKQP